MKSEGWNKSKRTSQDDKIDSIGSCIPQKHSENRVSQSNDPESC